MEGGWKGDGMEKIEAAQEASEVAGRAAAAAAAHRCRPGQRRKKSGYLFLRLSLSVKKVPLESDPFAPGHNKKEMEEGDPFT